MALKNEKSKSYWEAAGGDRKKENMTQYLDET